MTLQAILILLGSMYIFLQRCNRDRADDSDAREIHEKEGKKEREKVMMHNDPYIWRYILSIF